MVNVNVVDELVDVQFYTALDPYYYIVDNRPLRDLDENVRLTAQAVDDLSGSSDRAALAATSAGYAIANYTTSDVPEGGNYIGTWSAAGVNLKMEYGFSVAGLPHASLFTQPKMSVHNKDITFPLIGGALAGHARAYRFYAVSRDSTTGDEFESITSTIGALDINRIQTASYVSDPSDPFLGAGFGSLPTGAIPLFQICIRYETVDINLLPDNHIEYLQMKTIAEISDPLSVAKLRYIEDEDIIPALATQITITNPEIDFANNPDSIELFLDGVNQFNYNLNTDTGVITIPQVTYQTHFRVRQLKISLR